METYLTIEELAKHLKLSGQTIRRYVLNREIPYHKIKKAIRFRLAEIETWIDGGGGRTAGGPDDSRERYLFADLASEQIRADGDDGETGDIAADSPKEQG
jgi:excisionase family DNA binding protein